MKACLESKSFWKQTGSAVQKWLAKAKKWLIGLGSAQDEVTATDAGEKAQSTVPVSPGAEVRFSLLTPQVSSPTQPFGSTGAMQPLVSEAAPPLEPLGLLDSEEPPETYDIDEVTVLARDPHTLFATWEVTNHGINAARQLLTDEGALTLRLFVAARHIAQGVVTTTRDVRLDHPYGRCYLTLGQPGCHVAAAVGLLTASGMFAPIVHAPLVFMPYSDAGPVDPLAWMEVIPSQRQGRELEPPRIRMCRPAVDTTVPTAALSTKPKAWSPSMEHHPAGSFGWHQKTSVERV